MSPAPGGGDEARGPIAFMAKNSVAANVLLLVLVVGGIGMLTSRMKFELFPEVELDSVMINIAYPGASPAEVEQGVVLSVEEAVRGLDGVKEVHGSSFEGLAVVRVDLLLGADKDRALNDVKSAVDRITSFPQEAERPTVALATNRQEVISLVLYGDLEEASLRQLAEDARMAMLADPEITYVELAGVRPLEIGVEVPEEQLRRHRLSLQQIAQTITQASVEVPGGGVRTRGGEVLLRTDERRSRGSEFGDIVIRSQPDGSTLRVRDIATVRDGFQEVDYAASFDGQPAAMVKVFRVGSETPISVADAVERHVEQLRTNLPPGAHVATWADRSEMYRQRMDLLMRNGALGLLLVLLILGLMLEPRLAIWVTVGIPVSFAGALLFLPGADVSINMISLFGFILVLGMVVDDAIVVGEAIYQRRMEGEDWLSAAISGARDVSIPVVFSVLTTCVAFAPLLFVPGLMGQFFRVVPIVVISVLIISLVESLLVLPAHLSHPMHPVLDGMLRPLTWSMEKLGSERISQGLERFVERVYQPVLRKALDWRYLTLAIAVGALMLVVGLVAGGRIQFTFLPKIEGDVIVATLRMPVGTPVEETERHHERMIEVAQEVLHEASPESSIARGIFAELGAASTLEAQPMGTSGNRASHLSTVMIYLVQSDDRELTTAAFVQRWRERIGEVPGAENLTFRYSIGASPGQPIHVQLDHTDTATLEQASMRLATVLSEYGGLSDIDNGVSTGKEQLNFRLTPLGRAHGLTEIDLARQVRNAFHGAEAVRQQRGRDEVRVYVRRPLEERRSLHDLENLIIQTPQGGEIPLHQAAQITRGRAYTVIRRIEGRRTINVTADVIDGRANANEVVSSLIANELPRLMGDFPGLGYSLGGEQEQQQESLGSLKTGGLMALVVMAGMLMVVFRSYAQPLLVMTSIPFGIVGAVIGHMIMGYTLSLMTLMGLVALSGVVVNGSLVLIVAINDYRRNPSTSLFEAVVQGATRRFRPIVLTSLTTFFGLAPMILETSVQARFLIPMAISLAFGVLFATGITLLLLPGLYLILEDAKRGIGRLVHGATGADADSTLSPASDAAHASSAALD